MEKYEIWPNSSSLIDFIEYISSRIIDIITYFFQTTNYHLLLLKILFQLIFLFINFCWFIDSSFYCIV